MRLEHSGVAVTYSIAITASNNVWGATDLDPHRASHHQTHESLTSEHRRKCEHDVKSGSEDAASQRQAHITHRYTTETGGRKREHTMAIWASNEDVKSEPITERKMYAAAMRTMKNTAVSTARTLLTGRWNLICTPNQANQMVIQKRVQNKELE